ncbi:arsenate reductase (glutaredoxin) [soil metagenome]
MRSFPLTIVHNPAGGTSRNTLAAIRESGYEPEVVEYLKTGWTRKGLEGLLTAMNAAPRDLLRDKEAAAAELGLTDPSASDETILAAMIAHPVLVQRPIVITPKGTKMCRPSELVFDLLERPPEVFTKEDGEQVKLHR